MRKSQTANHAVMEIRNIYAINYTTQCIYSPRCSLRKRITSEKL